MKRVVLTILLAIVVLMPGGAYAASTICTSGATCSSAEVGPFMAGITKACGNEGDCSLADIETVFANAGNWILGIIGALVFLMYVVGGFYFLLSGLPGMEKYREKGKTALKQSTVGLIIVFVAFAALTTLNSVLRYGSLPEAATAYVSCGPGSVNDGSPCGLNSTCVSGACVTQCEQNYPNERFSGSDMSTAYTYRWASCMDITDQDTLDTLSAAGYVSLGCETNLCPGDENFQCCRYQYTY